MGWADCGINPTWDVPMGYAYGGICMDDLCTEEIDHGLAYVCGGMHEGGEAGCGRYFCRNHLYPGLPAQLCEECLDTEEEDE